MAGGGHATGEAVLGVTLSFTILAVVAACLRLLTRFFISKAAGADDAFVAVSTVSIPVTISLGIPLTRTDSHSCTDCCSLWSR